MATTVAQIEGLPPSVLASHPQLAEADWLLDWRSPRRNAVCTITQLQQHLPAALSPLSQDFLDVATAVYLADVAVQRGRNEYWTRDIELVVAVRNPDFWESVAAQFSNLVHRLTGDNFDLIFYPRLDDTHANCVPARTTVAADSVCLLSGGLDSLAGAVMLLQTGCRPHLVMHYSGNPTVRAAQDYVQQLVAQHWRDRSMFSGVHVAPDTRTPQALPYPDSEAREPSRRTRSLLYMTLGAVTAATAGLEEVYIAENGVLTAALPLTLARAGSLSTRSTHPAVINLFNGLCEQAGWPCRVRNPFIYQTKAELIRDVLRPVLSPLDIQRTVSCWMTGRANRQCGGCIPCLVRRIALLAAGLPDEAYMMDLLGDPMSHVGTDAFTNLVDLLNHTAAVQAKSDEEVLQEYPRLLELATVGISLSEVIAMLRRHATEVHRVVTERFPESARLVAVI